jgi:hypothetical protein
MFRLEILTKEMDRTVIASEGFVARLTESTAFDDLGDWTVFSQLKVGDHDESISPSSSPTG